MDPNQQDQGGPPANPYDFILNPEKPPKPQPVRGFFRSFAGKLILILFSALVFMLVVTLLINALAPKQIGRTEMVGVAQTQQELIRISDQGARDSRQQVTKNLATTIQYTMLTQQKRTLQVLGTVGEKELSLKQKASTDQQFASAKATSTFDAVFAKVAQEELNGYANELKALFNIAATDHDRDLLSDFYQQTQLLIAQIPYTQEGIGADGP